MKTKIVKTTLTFLFVLFMATALNAAEIITEDIIEKEILTLVDYVKVADNFIIMFDSSGSARKNVPGTDMSRIDMARQVLKERNLLLPNLGYNAGLYLYTPFKAVYKMQPYDRERFAAAIDKLPNHGNSPTLLYDGLVKIKKELSHLKGHTVIAIFTDGTYSKVGNFRPLNIAREIAKKHDVTFILISSAEASDAKDILRRVSSLNARSRVIPLTTLYNRPEYLSGALYDVKVGSLLKITAYRKVVGLAVDNVLFDFDSTALRPEYADDLDEVGKFLMINPDAFVVLDGYADGIGGAEYNLELSMSRAENIKQYILDNYDIVPDRVVTMWYGMLNPAASNDTPEGRSLNRRVEFSVGGLE